MIEANPQILANCPKMHVLSKRHPLRFDRASGIAIEFFHSIRHFRTFGGLLHCRPSLNRRIRPFYDIPRRNVIGE
jgi:hypothetical protein